MKKLWSLALVSAALFCALPTVASADNWHGGGRHGNRGHGHGHVRAFVPVPVAVYAPRPVYYGGYYGSYYDAPCPPPRAYYPAAYAVPVPVTPFIAVRTPHVAVSIGGFFPY